MHIQHTGVLYDRHVDQLNYAKDYLVTVLKHPEYIFNNVTVYNNNCVIGDLYLIISVLVGVDFS